MAQYAALFAALFAVIGAAVGARRHNDALIATATRILPWVLVFIACAALGLTLALVHSDFSLRYVAEHTTANLPTLYKGAALLAGTAGRALAFALILSACIALAVAPVRQTSRAKSTVALALIMFLTLAWTTLGTTPFERLPWQLAEGSGLAPSLQSPLLFLREPVVLLGYALLLVAGALALSAETRAHLSRWLLAAWNCDLVAALLGARQGLAVAAWLVATSLLLLPFVRRQWWPTSRTGARLLLSATGVAAILTTAGGFAARMTKEYSLSLGQGESASLPDAYGVQWAFAQQGVSAFREENREITAVTLEAARGNGQPTLLVTQRRQAVDSRGEEIAEPVVVAGRRHGLAQEITVTLQRTLPGDAAEVRIDFQPLKSSLTAAYVVLFASSVACLVRALRQA